MIFAKKLILSSVFAIGAFGLIACGSDSKPSTEPDPNQPGGKIEIPTQKDANITVTEFTSRISGDDVRFKGQFGLGACSGSSSAPASSFRREIARR